MEWCENLTRRQAGGAKVERLKEVGVQEKRPTGRRLRALSKVALGSVAPRDNRPSVAYYGLEWESPLRYTIQLCNTLVLFCQGEFLMKNVREGGYVLGLDLGSASVGWAAVRLGEKDKPCGILAIGSRVFDQSLQKGSLEGGSEIWANAQRRMSRGQRRREDRHVRRLNRLFMLFQNHGLLVRVTSADRNPRLLKGAAERRQWRDDLSEQRHKVFSERKITRALVKKWREILEKEGAPEKTVELVGNRLPYFLRARAISQRLELDEVARAIYHLAERRGFKSRRTREPEEKKGVVWKNIEGLRKKMLETNTKTYGEYFWQLPAGEAIRGHEQFTERKVYEAEFKRIWDEQHGFYPSILTDRLGKEIADTIFRQRPLRSQADLIGECAHESGQKRAPMAVLLAQRFRIIDKVNNLIITEPNGIRRGLHESERKELIKGLEKEGDLTFAKIKKNVLQLPGCSINLEGGKEKKLPGNRTAAELRQYIDDWDDRLPAEQDKIIDDILSIQKNEALENRLVNHWHLARDKAKLLVERVELEDEYCNLSRKAIRNLLPLMEEGTRYMTAVSEKYPEKPVPAEDELPPVVEAFKKLHKPLRNPAVVRTLTELRKVVNLLAAKCGKPRIVRIELARDLRRSKKERHAYAERMRQNQNARDAVIKFLKERNEAVTGENIEKVLLWLECDGWCPYSGTKITPNALFSGEVQVEHIIPKSKCHDDSFMNKTLCMRNVNLEKKNRTPFQTFGKTPEWEGILRRVGDFKWVKDYFVHEEKTKSHERGPKERPHPKLSRFRIENDEELGQFCSRQLNDTRYATRLAADYMGLLFGTTEKGVRSPRVEVSVGQMTYVLRNRWGVNGILSDGGMKSRNDHRHHAVDALVVACSDSRARQALSRAEESWETSRRKADIGPPWDGFLEEAREEVGNVTVSYRASQKAKGELHNANPIQEAAGKQVIGSGPRRRTIETGSNHHMEIFAKIGEAGRECEWKWRPVTVFEAVQRVRPPKGKPKRELVNRVFDSGWRWKFSLASRDTVKMSYRDCPVGYFTVHSISGSEIEFRPNQDAITPEMAKQLKKKYKKEGRSEKMPRYRVSGADKLREFGAQKVHIDPLGSVREAND